MPRGRIDAQNYDDLITAFRRPGEHDNIKGAATLAKVSWKTAERGLNEGWPKMGFPPIRAVLEQEKIQARARINAEVAARNAIREKEQEDSFKNAVEARKQEGQMVQLIRAQTLQALTVSMQLTQAGRALAPILSGFVNLQGKKLEQWTAYEFDMMTGGSATPPTLARPALTAHQALDMLQKVAQLSTSIVHSARQAMDMERLHLGKPTAVIGIVDSREITIEEAEARFDAAANAMRVFREADGEAEENGPTVGERIQTH